MIYFIYSLPGTENSTDEFALTPALLPALTYFDYSNEMMMSVPYHKLIKVSWHQICNEQLR